jgi:hypothetical protein
MFCIEVAMPRRVIYHCKKYYMTQDTPVLINISHKPHLHPLYNLLPVQENTPNSQPERITTIPLYHVARHRPPHTPRPKPHALILAHYSPQPARPPPHNDRPAHPCFRHHHRLWDYWCLCSERAHCQWSDRSGRSGGPGYLFGSYGTCKSNDKVY